MTTHELLTDLHRQGISLTALPGGFLEVRPSRNLTPELRKELKQRKAEVLAALAASQAPTCSCGHNKDVWQVNRGTCWAQWVCCVCQDKVAMPTVHLCDSALLLDERCKGQQSNVWSCPQCSYAIRLEPPDEHAPTRFWKCTHCKAWGATREGAPYPTVWVGTGTMQ